VERAQNILPRTKEGACTDTSVLPQSGRRLTGNTRRRGVESAENGIPRRGEAAATDMATRQVSRQQKGVWGCGGWSGGSGMEQQAVRENAHNLRYLEQSLDTF
jgi:hypothetical protein